MHIPAIRWGESYRSLEVQSLLDCGTGEPVAEISQANEGLLRRDMRRADQARERMRELAPAELVGRLKQAAEFYVNATLPIGDETQSPDQFVSAQSATTGLPHRLCRSNMQKNAFVLEHIDEILEALTRGLDREILSRGYGRESRGVIVSYQAQAPVLGAVLPSNSPGVHSLWLPVIALQLGLVLKPGSQEPWTPYRAMAALVAAGIPREAFGIYPGGHDVAAGLLALCQRSMIFGGAQTVEQYHGNPRVQVHGPGFSKILLGDDQVDDWPRYVDLMIESVQSNGGRSCINCSSIWASRHTHEIAAALAERLGPVPVRPLHDPDAELAAFTNIVAAEGIWKAIDGFCQRAGAQHLTERFGQRLVKESHRAFLRPVVLHAPVVNDTSINQEFMFPFVTVVQAPQSQWFAHLGKTLVCTAITQDAGLRRRLLDCTDIDRLNIGPIPTSRVDWMQPHEGNLIEFLYRSRAFQIVDE